MTDEERDLDLRDLRMLDPARAPRPDAGREPAARAMLDDILQRPQSGSSASGVDRIAGRSGWRRWVVAGTAVAAVTVGLVTLPQWGQPEHAFATWTPTPQEVPAEAAEELTGQCITSAARERLGQEVVIIEERGRLTFVVTATPYQLGYCLLVDGQKHISGSAMSPNLRGQHPEVAPADVLTYMSGGGGSDEESYQAVIGRTGEDVVGVEVHLRGELVEPGALPSGQFPESVTATVENGYYGAWWPGIAEDFELTVHLADGSVITNVLAYEHEG